MSEAERAAAGPGRLFQDSQESGGSSRGPLEDSMSPATGSFGVQPCSAGVPFVGPEAQHSLLGEEGQQRRTGAERTHGGWEGRAVHGFVHTARALCLAARTA